MAASSAQHSAPVMVISPAIAHAASSQPGAPTSRDDSADTIKMPDPIIEPMTIMVASSNPSPRVRLEDSSRPLRVSPAVLSIPLLRFGTRPPLFRRQLLKPFKISTVGIPRRLRAVLHQLVQISGKDGTNGMERVMPPR